MAAPPPGPYGAPPAAGQPVTGQPAPMQWMARPETIPGCPPGLEYLSQIDQLLVQQQVEIMEMITGWETANKYKVKNSMGQQVYFAAEESDACSRQCCGAARGFIIHITDNQGQELIRVNRDFKCGAGCPWFACVDACAHMVRVEAPVGTTIGYIRQAQSFWQPMYSIMNANMDEMLVIEGPLCMIQGPFCTQDMEFVVTYKDSPTPVGKISKQWGGYLKEAYTDADNFGVSFPMDLDTKTKATMLGAVFLIDFMFFEKSGNNNN